MESWQRGLSQEEKGVPGLRGDSQANETTADLLQCQQTSLQLFLSEKQLAASTPQLAGSQTGHYWS